MLELGWAKEATTELLAELDVMLAERDKMLDDAENATSAKKDLKQALEEATTEATALRLQKLDAETSIRQLSNQVVHALEEASRLSSKLGTTKVEVATL
ncbi:hypothetical protein ACLOJK_018640 [Asimina triloba]